MEIYVVNLCIQSKYWNIRTRNNSVFGHFSRSVSFITEICQFLRNCYVSWGLYLGALKFFGWKKPGKNVQCISVLKLYPDFLSCFLVSTSFDTTPLILLEIGNHWKVTNSGGLLLVWRWADINTLVQNKFLSTIHLLSQHSLAQSHRWKHQMNLWNLLKVTNLCCYLLFILVVLFILFL